MISHSHNVNNTKGFVALTSLIIVSSLIVVFIILGSQDTVSGEQDFIRAYTKEQQTYDAESSQNDTVLINQENN